MHLPFEMFKIKSPTNLGKLAKDSDMMVGTLWAINTCKDLGAKGRQPWDLTEEGLMACTLPCSDPDLARVAAPAAAKPPSQAQAAAPAPAVPARQPQASLLDPSDASCELIRVETGCARYEQKTTDNRSN